MTFGARRPAPRQGAGDPDPSRVEHFVVLEAPCLEPYLEMTKGPLGGPSSRVSRRRPTLPPRLRSSTIGAGGLNFRVRNGTGCLPSAKATETVCEPPGCDAT